MVAPVFIISFNLLKVMSQEGQAISLFPMFTYEEMKIQGSNLLKIPGLFRAWDKNYKILVLNLYFSFFIIHSISLLFTPSPESHEDCCRWNEIYFKIPPYLCPTRPHDEPALCCLSHGHCAEDGDRDRIGRKVSHRNLSCIFFFYSASFANMKWKLWRFG